ncbi:IS1634 family transposase [Desulfofundulus salinus]|uniref:IS1634 family transposase n=1 Tax=Desulfofundulus salinus TaxID=2419843 RepID=A0A494WXI2_9FIRM|nr:IS1634 family transposase [Desulfofundulus salinum]RKO65595.1 IS1634 family transposase [Desulfofundulus salinum]
MFFRKVTSRSGGKEYTYLKLIENYREGNKVKQRVIANLGNLENLTPEKVEGLIDGLARICGVSRRPANIEARKVLRYGEVLAIHRIWEMLDVGGAVEAVFSGERYDPDTALLLELMAINQIIKPPNKQAISDWYRCLYFPEAQGKEFLDHHFYRALDSVASVKERLEEEIFQRLCAFTRVSREVAFCLLTTATVEPAPRSELDHSPYGRYILEAPLEEQLVYLGILVSREGMPFGHRILHEVPDEGDFREIVHHLQAGHGTRQCIFVGDRRLVSGPHLEVLVSHSYHYLVRRKIQSEWELRLCERELVENRAEFKEVDRDLWYKEVMEGGVRYLVCYSPAAAKEKVIALAERLDEVEEELRELQKTAASEHRSGKRTLPRGAAVLKDKYCRRYFDWHYNEATGELTWRRKEDVITREEKTAGAFLLETNATLLDGRELLLAYTRLGQLGESFKEIRSFEARPKEFYRERNLSASIFVCVLAAMLEKTLEGLLKRAGIPLTSRQALELLEEVKVAINRVDDVELKSVTSIEKTQEEILQAIGVPDPRAVVV